MLASGMVSSAECLRLTSDEREISLVSIAHLYVQAGHCTLTYPGELYVLKATAQDAAETNGAGEFHSCC